MITVVMVNFLIKAFLLFRFSTNAEICKKLNTCNFFNGITYFLKGVKLIFFYQQVTVNKFWNHDFKELYVFQIVAIKI